MMNCRPAENAFLFRYSILAMPGRYVAACLVAAVLLGVAGQRMDLMAQSFSFGMLCLAIHFALLLGYRRGRYDAVACIFMHAALAVGICHLFHTHYTQYVNDIAGHTRYITYLYRTRSLPLPEGWQTQQPPLYYIMAALAFACGKALALAEPMQAARCLSLGLYTAFLMLSMSLLYRLVPHGGMERWLGAAVIAFWPEGFQFMVRVSTDTGMLICQAVTLYALVLWHQERRPRQLACAIAAASVALAVKGSAVLCWGGIFLVVMWHAWRRGLGIRQWRMFPVLGLALLAAAGMAVNFGRIALYRYQGHEIYWFMNIKKDMMPTVPLQPSGIYHYLYLDYLTLIRYPLLHANDEGYQSYWTFFLRTLVLGEWNWPSPSLMALECFFLLLIIGFGLTQLFRVRWPDNRFLPLVAMAASLVGGSIASHMVLPWVAQANARYAFSLIAIIAVFYASALHWHRSQGRSVLYYLGMAAGAGFSLAGLALIAGFFI